MTHIVDCMRQDRASYGLNNMIARELSPSQYSQFETVRHYSVRRSEIRLIEKKPISNTPSREKTEKAEKLKKVEKEKHVWRLLQPVEPRRYQLFPAKDKLSIASERPDSEQILTLALDGQPEQPISRQRSRDNLRRRKVSVPELGTMATVQEVTMDSRKWFFAITHPQILTLLSDYSRTTSPP